MRASGLEFVAAVLAILTGFAVARSAIDAVIMLGVAAAFIATARTRRRFAPIGAFESAFVPALALLPTVLGFAAFSERRMAVVAGGLVVLAIGQKSPSAGSLKHPGLVLALVAALLLPASRYLSTQPTEVVHGFALIVLLVSAARFPFPSVVFSILDGVAVYLIANVMGHLAGLQSTAAATRTFALESSTGGTRVFFPLTTSLAVPPLMAAIFVAAGLICFEGRGRLRAVRMLGFFAAVFVMIAANTRAAILVAVVVLLASVFAPKVFARVSVPVAVLPMVLAFVYPFLAFRVVQPLIASVVGVLPFLSRGHVSSDVALEGRIRIWESTVSFWQSEVDTWHRLIGYGELGRLRSGAAAAYAQGDPLLMSFSSHNSTLQQLFDGGLLGVLALSAAGLWAVRLLAKKTLASSRVHLIAMGALVAAILGGSTEVSLAPGYASETFWVFAGLIIAAAFVRKDSSVGEAPEGHGYTDAELWHADGVKKAR